MLKFIFAFLTFALVDAASRTPSKPEDLTHETKFHLRLREGFSVDESVAKINAKISANEWHVKSVEGGADGDNTIVITQAAVQD